MRKVTNCYGCHADSSTGCLLGYEREAEQWYIQGPKGRGHITTYAPKECCHKPRTLKEFTRRFNDR